MAYLNLLMRRQLPRTVNVFGRLSVPLGRPARAGALPVKKLHSSSRFGEKPGPLAKTRAPEQHHRLTELDMADALILRKSHETGFLSWFRNGLLATGIGVIAFVQSEMGQVAAYAFFTLGGVCVLFGGASYIANLFALRRLMLLSAPGVLLHWAVVGIVALFWLFAVTLYIGRLEVEIIHKDEEGEDEGECSECRERRGYSQDSGGKGRNK